MKHYTVQLVTPKLDHVVTETVEASSFGGAEKAARKAWEWAKPLTIKAIWVEENPDADYSDKEAHITLPGKLRNALTCYLLMSTKYREKERDAWRNLSKEIDEDGTPHFKNAESNADFWENMIQELKDVQEIIDNA